VGEVVSDGPPGFVLEQVEHDEVLVVAWEKETWSVNGLAVTQRCELIVKLIVLEGEDGQWHGEVEAVFAEQGGKDGAHLLKAEGDLTSFLVAGVGDDREVYGVDLKPWRLGGVGGNRRYRE